MKKISVVLSMVILTFLGVVFCSDYVSAKQKDPLDLIYKVTKAKPKNCGNHNNPYNSTLFNVKFSWGAGCNDNICDEIDGTFHCIDPGDHCTTTSHVHNGSIKVTSASCPGSVDSDKWDCYSVEIPADGAYQDMKGKIKRLKEFDLVAHAKTTINGVTKDLKNNISSDTAFYGNNASVTSAGYNPEGYTWNHWGPQGKCSGAGSNRACSVTMKGDYTVNAWYTRNSFSGRAMVNKGGDSNGTLIADTDYIRSDTTKSAEIDCKNSGCKAYYRLYLKRIAGDGSTYFTGTGDTYGGWEHVSPYKPSADGSLMRKRANDLLPGQEKCNHITFRPYGNLGNTTTSTAKACVKAKVTTFEGKSSVTGSTSGTTDWKNTNTEKTFFIDNCSTVNGCKVRFDHRMRAVGIGSTNYTVSRTSNLTNTDKAVAENSNLKTETFSGNDAEVYKSDELTLYPGMVVCEKLEFKPSNDTTKTVNKVYTKVCASALGNAQPDDPNPDTPEDPNSPLGDSSFLNIKVRNTSVAKWNKFQREVYAKPTDRLEYRTTYNPVLQYTYYLKPEQMKIDGGNTIYDNNSARLSSLFNQHKTPHWNNSISIFSSNFTTASYDRNFKYTNGSQTKQVEKNSHVAQTSEVGRSVDETARTNRNTNVQTTLSQVHFTKNSDKNLADAITAAIAKTAHARVPYNFVNTTEVLDNQDTFYAGEDATIDFNIYTNPRQNDLTDGNYATIVRGAMKRLIVCIDGIGCMTTADEPAGANGILNNNSAISLKTVTTPSTVKINIPDSPAGTNVCIRSQVFPASSGNPDNWQYASGDGLWATSKDQKCFKIAKRPSLQVWGGNVYTGGNIVTGVSTKGHLAGYNGYGVQTKYSKRIFGSWTELGVITNASVKGFGSGASTGYLKNTAGVLWPNYRFVGADGTTKSYLGGGNAPIANEWPGGSAKTNFCDRIPLTIANDPCDDKGTRIVGTSASMNEAAKDKTNILNKLMSENENLNGADYSYSAGNLSIEAMNINETDGKVKVFYAASKAEINGDIVYAGSYSELKQVPKVVIYAKDIIINCNVNRIDALLIADREVKTCNSDDINARSNSNQLIVNGAIVTNKLIANRTYGAANGANSIISAEIINFDPTLYLWGGTTVDGGGSQNNKLDTAYTHELAPRQ